MLLAFRAPTHVAAAAVAAAAIAEAIEAAAASAAAAAAEDEQSVSYIVKSEHGNRLIWY